MVNKQRCADNLCGRQQTLRTRTETKGMVVWTTGPFAFLKFELKLLLAAVM